MKRRNFLVNGAAALPLMAGWAPRLNASRVERAEPPQPPLGAKAGTAAGVDAPLKSRYQLSLNRVLHGTSPAYTTAFLMEDILATRRRRFTNFSGDVSGRWIGAVATSSATYGENIPQLREVVQQVIAQQHPEGYFGKVFRYENQDDDDMALLWGNGRLLIGLAEYYAYQPDPAVLAAARKLGDFLIRISADFNTQKKADEFGAAHYGSSYICWTQQTEGLAALYALTKDERYRDLCVQISKRIERRPSDHVHGYLCSVRGVVDLYRQTGDPALLAKAVAEWKSVMGSGDVLNTGGVPERWSPLAKRTEGCAECDWLRLNLAMYDVTGEPAYLDAAEKVLFNEYAMNQFQTGDFGHGVLTATGTPDEVVVCAWWCCTLHGLRTFADVSNAAFAVKPEAKSNSKTVTFVLPVDAAVARDGFAAQSSSRLATDGTVRIHVTRSDGHALAIRKPAWANTVAVTLNGHAVSGSQLSSVKAGDVVLVRYGMSVREEKAGDSPALATRRSFSYGPWLLGATQNLDPAFFGEHQLANKLLRSTLTASSAADSGAFAVPIAARSVGYVPAEFPDQPGTIQLRAVAEQTSKVPTRWETTFITVDQAGPVVSS